jgi:uncharacterized protein
MDKISKEIAAQTVSFAVRIFKTIFALPNGACRFEPTCSAYAGDALRKYPIYKAVPMIIKRVFRCNPLCKGGYDPLP